MLTPDAPFVLLDDARAAGAAPARLYRSPVDTVVATTPAQVPRLLDALRVARQGGLHAAGFLSYEAGHALEPRLVPAASGEVPYAWFGLFEACETLAPEAVPALLPEPAGAWAGPPRPLIDEAAYMAAFDRVQALIAAGDVYQANLTFRAEVRVLGHPLALYAAIRRRAQAGHGGVVWTGDDWLLSFSPELFFALKDGKATTRPMKGTAPRESDPADLAADPKQRAENLMIVDLLRNDLSRVAAPGSVEVPELFRVESYPTVHQMVSTITARLDEGRDAIDLLEALFPCGSITGAPKIRAMEVIGEIEETPRGIYCGAVGRLDADGDAAFNVAIRTLAMKEGADAATLGLGSGVVADSKGAEEWDECLAKGYFVAAGQRTPDLIETMAFDPHDGIVRLDAHMARMKASAAAFGVPFDRHAARNDLQAATFRQREPARVRLLLSPSGRTAIHVSALPPFPAEPVEVAIVPLPVAAEDCRLRHKTADRAFYDEARRASGAFEVLFVRPDGRLTEGSFTNLFVARAGRLLTPPARLGLLPGILRGELIEQGKAIEANLMAADLSGDFWIGNALRGMIRARTVAAVQHPAL
ncbi:aminodeoxychorismate synthase component I [Sphingomonas gilva]|uniref:Probable branched-chain-amino-acid aminotransferase n=1 Tax=Sphingomonas gilva TaxID=2305907 RepID=A0A396RTK8_9SPHN|nr:aminodeoxychorismate synthase component I [Sphingomonas gilva]RHW18732.1 aminodeoxychorismate synthase component I [Sphingomonas gilva]